MNTHKEVQVTIRGVRPLLMNNGQKANPLNPLVRKLSELTKKRKKTEEDHEKISDAEFMAGLYWDDELGVVMPAENITSMIQAAARKIKMGRQTFGILIDDPLVPIQFENHMNLRKLQSDHSYRLVKPVKVGTSTTMRTRPRIPTGWEMSFNVIIDINAMDLDQFEQILEIASLQVGLGDWRPGSPRPGYHGTFEILDVKEVA